MSWPIVKFELLYSEPSRNGIYKPAQFHGSGTKIVNMGELFAHDFVGSQEMARLNLSQAELDTSGLRDGDLLFGRRSLVEAGAGKCSIVVNLAEPTTFESSLIRVRLVPECCNPLFYYYWFKSPLGRGKVRSIVSGTNVKGIRGSDLKTLNVINPDLPIQDRIVEYIQSYDSLIENNRRRIGLLEEAARLLYREWFVHFRFPGHEHVKFTNGLPDGWAQRELELVCIDGGGIQTGPFGSQLHQSDYSETGIPVVMPKDLVSFRIDSEEIARIPESFAEKLARHRMSKGDTVYGRRGDIGRRAFISAKQTGWICGTGCLRIRPNPKEINPRFLFDALGAPGTAGAIANRAKGATMLNLNATLLKSVPVLVPPRPLQELYAEQVQPMGNMIEMLSESSTKLKVARDLLLPRLMSGEIAV